MDFKAKWHLASVVCTFLMLGIVCTAGVTATAAENDSLDPRIWKIVSIKLGENTEETTVVKDMVRESLNDPAKCLAIEKQFAVILESDATYACKDFVCRQLWLMGTKASVPALSKMLLEEKMSDMARYALQQNPCPEAGKALNNALKKAKGATLIGIINTLGERRDEKCVGSLTKLLYKGDDDVIAASASALGKIGTKSAKKSLDKAWTKALANGNEVLHRPVSLGLLTLADVCKKEGDNHAAVEIYKKLACRIEAVQVRKAALKGIEDHILGDSVSGHNR